MATQTNVCEESNLSDEDWSDIEDNEQLNLDETHCLFCVEASTSAVVCLQHMKDIHQVDLLEICRKMELDFYSYVKLINYIRVHKLDGVKVTKIEPSCFEDEKYLRPVLQDDVLLQINFDELVHCAADNEMQIENITVKKAEERALRAEEELARAIEDLNTCKAQVQKLLLQNSVEESENRIGRNMESHTAYFESYAHYGIHEEMLKDNIRTLAYKQFIGSNKDLFKDKCVLDIGCGTGILSMFAAKAGAKLVIAVDQSEIVYQAMDIVMENDLDKVIKVMKGNAEQLVLPNNLKKVDIIISEWMGYFLFFEGMLDTVIKCRDKYLSSDGMIYPDSCGIYMAVMSDETMWDAKVSFWDDVHGFKMSCMKDHVISEPLIEIVAENKIISSPSEVIKFDLMKIGAKDLDFKADFELNITKDSLCTGMVGFFNIGFEKCAMQPICFDTGYQSSPTHWKQTVFLFERKLPVKKGETLHCSIQCEKSPKDFRSLHINLFVEKEDKSEYIRQKFVLS